MSIASATRSRPRRRRVSALRAFAFGSEKSIVSTTRHATASCDVAKAIATATGLTAPSRGVSEPIHSVYDNPVCLALFPALEDDLGGRILELAFMLSAEASAFRQVLPDGVVDGIADTVRVMNCYYSNLIEGHDTRPLDIERAMRQEFSADKQKRDLQHEALAHILVQARIDQGAYDGLSLPDLARRIHADFYERMPPAFRVVQNADGSVSMPVVPGEYRTRGVEVGDHVAVDAAVVPAFMDHLAKGYAVERLREHMKPIAAAALHHRFLWVHPFPDGNGRVDRLLSHAYLREAGLGCGLWSVARGLAIFNRRYKAALARADYPPQGTVDGRGTLSAEVAGPGEDWQNDLVADVQAAPDEDEPPAPPAP